MNSAENSSKVLTFEMTSGGQELEIFCNSEGIDELITILSKLRAAQGRPQHDHLMTPSHAGYELSEDAHSEENKLLHVVTIRLLADK